MDKSVDVIITCTGKADDPDIQEKISQLLRKVSTVSGAAEDNFCLKSVEPWNSVRVTFNLPREAAVRLQELARAGDDGLINLGILSVQIANGELLDLNAIRELLQQELVPSSHIVPPVSQPAVSSVETVSLPDLDQPLEQKQQVPSKSFQTSLTLPTINHTQQQQSPNPPSRPVSSGSHPPAHPPMSSAGFPQSSGGVKPPFLMTPSLSIGNIPTGIPSPHLGNLNKTSTAAGNLAISSSFSSVYSIAMSLGGNQRPPVQTPVLQSLPNLPTPQTPPVGNFPWNIGAKPSRFLANRPPSGMPQWNQVPMFTGTPNLPTNLPGSIPSIGPIPTPSTIPNPRQEAPPAPKPKKKRVKRPRKPPKEKIPPIPLPPPLMPPDPKPPTSSDSVLPQKPPGLPLPIAMNPISPNETQGSVGKEAIPVHSVAPVSQTQHTRFPFNQTQVSQSGRSDVSMTSPLLVNLLQSDFASNPFPPPSGEQKGSGAGPVLTPHRMPTAANLPTLTGTPPAHHPSTGMLHPITAASQYQAPRNHPPSHFHPSLQVSPRIPLPQQSLSGEPVVPESAPVSGESFQQPFFPQMPFPHGMPGGVSTSFNRFQIPQVNFPQRSPQHLIPQSSSHPVVTENRLQKPHTQSNWTGIQLTMSTVAPTMSSESDVPTSMATAGLRRNSTQSPKLHSRDQVPKSAFDEESALAGMTEAERDTFVAAAKIAQDSKPPVTGIDAQSNQPTLPKSLPTVKSAKLPLPPAAMEGVQGKSVSNLFAVENLAISDQQVPTTVKNFSSPSGNEQRLDRSSSALVPQPVFPKVPSLPDGRKFLPQMPVQVSQSVTSLQSGEVLNQNVSNVQTSSTSAMSMSKPSRSFQSKPVMHHGQPTISHNPYLSLPPPVASSPAFSSTLSEQSQPYFTSTGSNTGIPVAQSWPVSATSGTKAADDFQFESKVRGSSVEYHGKQNLQATVPAKPGNYPFDWPFPNIAPPTQNLSSEGLQFMAKLAAVPDESDHQKQESSHFVSQEGLKLGKEDKPHLKALLNEISPSSDGHAASPRGMKRLSSEEKSERKRRKSSPRPATDQSQTVSQSHGKVDLPVGSLELPRVPTAEELSFNLQQARAHSLDLLKSGTGYPPLPKTAPSSPRAKGRPKSVENQPQYGMQQSDMFQGKHSGSSSPAAALPGSLSKSTGTSSKSSGKSKESKSRSKSPKSSGSKSFKADQPGFGAVQTVTSAASVPFAGVHEFHPPLGVNIRGPAKPGTASLQSRKTPVPVTEQMSPVSPSLPSYGTKQFQQQSQFPTAESQGISPLSARPGSPFKSASALLSSFALSAGKAPELPVTNLGSSQSPLSSPGYETTPLHQGSSSNTSGNTGMETKADLQCYSETLQQSLSESVDDLSRLPSSSSDPHNDLSPYPSDLVRMSDSLEQTAGCQSTFSVSNQSDSSHPSWRAPQVKRIERKSNIPFNKPVEQNQAAAEGSTSRDMTNAPFTLGNLPTPEKGELSNCSGGVCEVDEVPQKFLCDTNLGERQIMNADCYNVNPNSDQFSLQASGVNVGPSESVYPLGDTKQTDVLVTAENKQGQSTMQKSVIVVSSPKPNVTTIGVRKFGTSSEEYAVAQKKTVSMIDSKAKDVTSASHFSPAASNISRSQMQNVPLTRVTKVIPISSENRNPDDMFHSGPVITSKHSNESNPCVSMPSSISQDSRASECVISASVPGCGMPSGTPHVSDTTNSRNVALHNERSTPKVSAAFGLESFSPSRGASVSAPSNKDATSTAKSESRPIDKSDGSKPLCSVGSSPPVTSTVAQHHSVALNSGFVKESSAIQKIQYGNSSDVTRPLQVAPHQTQLLPDNSALRATSVTEIPPTSSSTVSGLPDCKEQQSTTGADVPSDVGRPSTDTEKEDRWRDEDLKGSSSNFVSSDPAVACVSNTHTTSEQLETAAGTASDPVSHEAPSATVPSTFSSTSPSTVDEGTPSTAKDLSGVKLAVDTKEDFPGLSTETVVTSVVGESSPGATDSALQCSEKAEECRNDATSQSTMVEKVGSIHKMEGTASRERATVDTKCALTLEENVGSGLDQSQTSKSGDVDTQKCHAHGEVRKSIDVSQSDNLELFSLDQGALDQEYETELGEETLEDDSIPMEMKIHGRGSPESETTEAPEESEDVQGDDHTPVTRKRSMRASGRDMYYGPIPTYKRRKPNQK